jgi:hypothetical protein
VQVLAPAVISPVQHRFHFALDVERGADGAPNFTGVFAHGGRSDRFLYLTQLGLKSGSWQIIKRIKIPLKTVTWTQVQAVMDGGVGCLAVRVSGQVAATAPLLGDGWITAALDENPR